MTEKKWPYEAVTTLSDNSTGYEWGEAGIAYKDGQYYWTEQSGCSCNMFEWPEDPDSWNRPASWGGRGSRHEAIALLNGLPEGDWGYARSVVDRAIQDVLSFKPGVN